MGGASGRVVTSSRWNRSSQEFGGAKGLGRASIKPKFGRRMLTWSRGKSESDDERLTWEGTGMGSQNLGKLQAVEDGG